MNLNDLAKMRDRISEHMRAEKGKQLTLGELADISNALTTLINLQLYYEVDVTANLPKYIQEG